MFSGKDGVCGAGSEEGKGEGLGCLGLRGVAAGMGYLPNLRREEQQRVYFPHQGPAVGLQKAGPSAPCTVGVLEARKDSLKGLPAGTTSPPLVISGSIYLVKKGVSGNANQEVLEVLADTHPVPSQPLPCTHTHTVGWNLFEVCLVPLLLTELARGRGCKASGSQGFCFCRRDRGFPRGRSGPPADTQVLPYPSPLLSSALPGLPGSLTSRQSVISAPKQGLLSQSAH